MQLLLTKLTNKNGYSRSIKCSMLEFILVHSNVSASAKARSQWTTTTETLSYKINLFKCVTCMQLQKWVSRHLKFETINIQTKKDQRQRRRRLEAKQKKQANTNKHIDQERKERTTQNKNKSEKDGFVFPTTGQSVTARQFEIQQTEQESSQYRRFSTQRITSILPSK